MAVVIEELDAELAPPPPRPEAPGAPEPGRVAAEPRLVRAALARELWRARRLLAD